MKKLGKNTKQIERHIKGIANHRRIEILCLIAKEEGINLDQISRRLGCNMKTIAEHVRRLSLAGLIDKNYQNRHVAHKLSPYGKIFYKFLMTFSHS